MERLPQSDERRKPRHQSELYSGGELYTFTYHYFIDGNFPAVCGSKLINRDHVDKRVLDFDGNLEYRLGILRGEIPSGDDERKMCSCPDHRGQRWLHLDGFARDSGRPDGKDVYCRKCRKMKNAQRYEERVGYKPRHYGTAAEAA